MYMSDEEERAIKSGPLRVLNWEEDIHLTPMGDWFDHNCDINCPCGPFMDPMNALERRSGRADRVLWIHRCIKGSKNLH